VIWNKTTIYNSYSGARAKDITGNAISNGINLNYSRTIYKNLFAKIGAGYFKQKFGMQRGFDYEETHTISGLYYSTEYYSYSTLTYFGGVGYNTIIGEKYNLRFLAAYNFFNTYKQEFKHDFNGLPGNINPQIRKDSYAFGSSIVLQPGISRPLYKNFRIGIDILLPVYNKWRKDKIFREDMNEFYGSDFSIGGSINFIYHFVPKK
jgi:hypothetical protein